MNRTWLLIALAGSVLATPTPATATPAVASAFIAQEASASNSPGGSELNTKKEKASYALGMNIGDSVSKKLQQDGIEVDHAIFLRGMNDALAGGQLLMTPDEAKTAWATVQAAARAKGVPVQAASPVAPLKLPSTYVSAQTPADRLQLNADNSIMLQEGGQTYHGTFVANGNALELNIGETGIKTTLSRQGDNLTDSSGQTWSYREQPSGTSPSGAVLHNEDIIKLAKVGIDDATIMEKIRSSRCQFDTSTDALVLLKKSGVSAAVLQAMVGAEQ